MNIMLINGSLNKNGCIYTALKEVADTLNEYDIETEIYYLCKKAVSGCIAYNQC